MKARHKIYWRGEISAAHSLRLFYESKCKRLHGHNYLVEIWIEGEKNSNGMIVDFADLKKIVSELDHINLNDVIEQPTAENIAEHIAEKIINIGNTRISEVKVRVWEDKDSYAEVIVE